MTNSGLGEIREMSEIVRAAAEIRFTPVGPGVEMGLVRAHGNGGMSALFRMKKGAVAIRHSHPGGEETLMLRGQLRIQNRSGASGAVVPDIVLNAGGYAFVLPGESHDAVAEEDSEFFVVAVGGLEPKTV